MSKKPDDKKVDATTLSPWAHPKAQQWFELIFERSGFAMGIRDALENSEQPVSPDQARLLMTVVMLLGREGMWPSNDRGGLQRLAMKLGRIARSTPAPTKKTKPLTIDEHRRRELINQQIEKELEFLRRVVGISKRVTELPAPDSWGKFWT